MNKEGFFMFTRNTRESKDQMKTNSPVTVQIQSDWHLTLTVVELASFTFSIGLKDI